MPAWGCQCSRSIPKCPLLPGSRKHFQACKACSRDQALIASRIKNVPCWDSCKHQVERKESRPLGTELYETCRKQEGGGGFWQVWELVQPTDLIVFLYLHVLMLIFWLVIWWLFNLYFIITSFLSSLGWSCCFLVALKYWPTFCRHKSQLCCQHSSGV